MKHLILNAMKTSLDLRIVQNKKELRHTGKISIQDMARDSADMIDRLAASLMLCEETLRRFSESMNMSNEDLNKIFDVIESADSKMLQAYEKINSKKEKNNEFTKC